MSKENIVYFSFRDDEKQQSMSENWLSKPETEEERIMLLKRVFEHLFYNIFDCYHDNEVNYILNKYFLNDNYDKFMSMLMEKHFDEIVNNIKRQMK